MAYHPRRPVTNGISAVSRRPGFITIMIRRAGVYLPASIEISATEAAALAKHLGRIVDTMQVADENLTALAAGQKERESNGSGI